jgi:type II secretory pathway pseudopilin PulG
MAVMSFKRERRAGFTIVEISIALAVVSFLVASVLVGSVLIRKAYTQKVVYAFQNYSTAIERFRNTYNELPGDMVNIGVFSSPNSWGVSLVAGNGNGLVDTAQEALQFWIHLDSAQLAVGNYDGVHAYPARLVSGSSGLPLSPIKYGGFDIITSNSTLPDSGTNVTVAIRLSRYAGTPTPSGGFAVLSTEEAQYIDKSIDDGNPLTGNIMAADGSDTSGKCVSGSSYILSSGSRPSCVIFYVMYGKAVYTQDATYTCSGAPVGSYRVSNDDTCDVANGYVGNVLQYCGLSAPSTYSWQDTVNMCSQTKCSGGQSPGSSITIPCGDGFTGYVTLTCQVTGVYSISSSCTPTTGCFYSTSNLDSGMLYKSTVGPSRNLACPLGTYNSATTNNGYVQYCSSTTTQWTSSSTLAAPCGSTISCGTTALGSDSSTTLACPTNYVSGVVYQTCTMPLSGTTGVLRATRNTCLPDYGSSCGGSGSTRKLNCPSGAGYETNQYHYQICNGTTWQTNYSAGGNNCQIVKCGHDPIGSIRFIGVACPLGYTGTMLEVCDTNGLWKQSSANCSPSYCVENQDEIGALWTSYQSSGSLFTNSTNLCPYPYAEDVVSSSSKIPIRICAPNGEWAALAAYGCVIPCLAGSAFKTSGTLYPTQWDETQAGTTAYIDPPGDDTGGYPENYCILNSGNNYTSYTPTQITRSCSLTNTGGVWATPSNDCVCGASGNSCW